MTNVKKTIETIGSKAFWLPSLRRASLNMAAAGQRGLVLCYHRIGPDGPSPHEVVPTLPCDQFRRQLEILIELGDIVPLNRMLEPPSNDARVKFAITFDDDYPHHVQYALPILQSLGVSATFFLSGRSLHGLGPYWWELLESAIVERGLKTIAELLGVSGRTPRALAGACEGTQLSERITEILGPPKEESGIAASSIQALVDSGMEIGFHTLHHPALSRILPREVDVALSAGRHELSAVTGKAVTFFAYPYGRCSWAVAGRVAAARFQAAFTNRGGTIRHDSYPYLLGRWEPRPCGQAEFRRLLALRLCLPAGGPVP